MPQIERRPLTLVAAATPDGDEASVILQNAETVKLIGPSVKTQGTVPLESDGGRCWLSHAVPSLAIGDNLLVLRSGAARHMGLAVNEHLIER